MRRSLSRSRRASGSSSSEGVWISTSVEGASAWAMGDTARG
ncbi:hypothetical protein STIAU_5793, partial [Stigmatella aurantiaca DW4/3-1]